MGRSYVSDKPNCDDVDNSPGVRLFNMWTTATQIAISSELNTWSTWFAGKGIHCGSSTFWVNAHMVIC